MAENKQDESIQKENIDESAATGADASNNSGSDSGDEETLATAETEAEAAKPEASAEADESGDDSEEATADEASKDFETQLKEALAESESNKENWQRTAAELANFKRRQEEQMKLQRDRIKSEVLQGVISALDDMDLAFQNLPDELDGQLIGWVEGFRLVQRKLDKVLDEQNVMPIDTSGTFDPNFHEAVSHEESEEHDADHIIAELRKGYQIGSRVIRPALVRVAR